MPRPEKTHDDCRQLFCLFCWRKGDPKLILPKYDGTNPAKKPPVITFIEKYAVPSFLQHRSTLPGGSCGNCRSIVSKHMKSDPDFTRPLSLPKSTKD